MYNVKEIYLSQKVEKSEILHEVGKVLAYQTAGCNVYNPLLE